MYVIKSYRNLIDLSLLRTHISTFLEEKKKNLDEPRNVLKSAASESDGRLPLWSLIIGADDRTATHGIRLMLSWHMNRGCLAVRRKYMTCVRDNMFLELVIICYNIYIYMWYVYKYVCVSAVIVFMMYLFCLFIIYVCIKSMLKNREIHTGGAEIVDDNKSWHCIWNCMV